MAISAGAIKAGEAYVAITAKDEQLRNSFRSLQTYTETLTSRITQMFTAVSVVAGAAGLRGVIDTLDEVGKTAKELRINASVFSAWRYAATLSGISVHELAVALARMNKVLGDASQEGQSAKKALETIGLSIDHLLSLSPEQRFYEIGRALEKITDPALRIATLHALFGRGSARLSVLFDSFTSLMEEARAGGYIYTPEQIKSMEEVRDNLSRISFQFEKISASIVQLLTPAFETLRADAALVGEAFTLLRKPLAGIDSTLISLATQAALAWGAFKLLKGVSGIFVYIGDALGKAASTLTDLVRIPLKEWVAAFPGIIGSLWDLVKPLMAAAAALTSLHLAYQSMRRFFGGARVLEEGAATFLPPMNEQEMRQLQQRHTELLKEYKDLATQGAVGRYLQLSFLGGFFGVRPIEQVEKELRNLEAVLAGAAEKRRSTEIQREQEHQEKLFTLQRQYAEAAISRMESDTIRKLATIEQWFSEEYRKYQDQADALLILQKTYEEKIGALADDARRQSLQAWRDVEKTKLELIENTYEREKQLILFQAQAEIEARQKTLASLEEAWGRNSLSNRRNIEYLIRQEQSSLAAARERTRLQLDQIQRQQQRAIQEAQTQWTTRTIELQLDFRLANLQETFDQLSKQFREGPTAELQQQLMVISEQMKQIEIQRKTASIQAERATQIERAIREGMPKEVIDQIQRYYDLQLQSVRAEAERNARRRTEEIIAQVKPLPEEARMSTLGTFAPFALWGIVGSSSPLERTARATEQMAKDIREIKQKKNEPLKFS